mgnify:CR=1 FL=1
MNKLIALKSSTLETLPLVFEIVNVTSSEFVKQISIEKHSEIINIKC